MNIISADIIRKKLSKTWPSLTGWFKGNRIWLRSEYYTIPNNVETILKMLDNDTLPQINGLNECENQTLFALAEIRKYQVRNHPEDNYPWPFGEMLAIRHDMIGKTVHSAIVGIINHEVVVIEPVGINKIRGTNNYETFLVNM